MEEKQHILRLLDQAEVQLEKSLPDDVLPAIRAQLARMLESAGGAYDSTLADLGLPSLETVQARSRGKTIADFFQWLKVELGVVDRVELSQQFLRRCYGLDGPDLMAVFKRNLKRPGMGWFSVKYGQSSINGQKLLVFSQPLLSD